MNDLSQDLSQKINDLLSTPDTMQKLQSALGALSENGGGDSGGDINALLASLGGLPTGGGNSPAPAAPEADAVDPGMLASLAPVLGRLSHDDQNTVLLRALRPYLHGEREKRLEDTISMMRLMRVLPLLGGTDLFGGGGHP